MMVVYIHGQVGFIVLIFKSYVGGSYMFKIDNLSNYAL